ncbi:META domain-containing protein [Mariniflexile sp.]|uniref:META domain-containing protein n=1 Tax=Mariniflexile sp. TaxID=1979402 RepID=UPI00404762A9
MNLKVLSANGNYLGYFKNNTNQIDSEGYDNTPVTITFNEDTFSGNTPRNSFFGEYIMNKDLLTFNQINTTEIAESDWGIRFTNALNGAYNATLDDYILKYSFKNNFLNIEYSSGNFMKFKRL